LFFNRDARRAELLFDRALNLGGEDSHLIVNYACYPQALGRLDEALEARRKAEILDPYSAIAMQEVAWPLYLLRRYGEAAAQFSKVVELEPTWYAGHYGLGKVRLPQYEFSEAIHHFRNALVLSNGSSAIQALLAHAFARDGHRAEALNILERLGTRSTRPRSGWFPIALVHVALGDADEAFRSLERACAACESAVLSVRTEPMLDDLRPDRRYRELLKRIERAD
jgi:tetratricopeptide (TPR) repeat protein